MTDPVWHTLPYPIPGLPDWQIEAMVELADALGDVPVSREELASLAIVARQGRDTVRNLAAVIRRARAAELVDWCRLRPRCEADGGES